MELKEVINNLPIGIIITDKENNIIYRNEMGKKFRIPKKGNLIKVGKNFYLIKRMHIPNGNLFIIEDVTERIKAEIALIESEEKYKAICENSLIGILIMKDNDIIYINKKFSDLLGYSPEKLKEKFFELIHPDDIKKFAEIFKGRVEVRMFNKNGKIKWFEMGCSPINYKGKAFLINAIDITKRIEMEMEIKEMSDRMHKTLEKEKRFLEEISHYFFNPICIAKGYLDLTIAEVNPSIKRKLEITRKAILRVENIVKHIVTEGKIYE